jgi:hypothetical protein
VGLLIMLPVARLLMLFGPLLVMPVATLPVMLLVVRLLAPMSDNAAPVMTTKDRNRREKDRILCSSPQGS